MPVRKGKFQVFVSWIQKITTPKTTTIFFKFAKIKVIDWKSTGNLHFSTRNLHSQLTTRRLTLNCIRYPALPLVHNGGFHGTPPEKTTFPPEFFLIIFTPNVYTLITTIFQGKKKILPFQNGGQITDFHFASFRFRPKFEKPLSQRNFSMKFGSN